MCTNQMPRFQRQYFAFNPPSFNLSYPSWSCTFCSFVNVSLCNLLHRVTGNLTKAVSSFNQKPDSALPCSFLLSLGSVFAAPLRPDTAARFSLVVCLTLLPRPTPNPHYPGEHRLMSTVQSHRPPVPIGFPNSFKSPLGC